MFYMRPRAPFQPLAHKVACLNLYRTLLQLTKCLPLSPPLRETTASQIKYHFHLHKNLQGRQIPLALDTGYKLESLLRSAANNDPQSLTTLRNDLKSILLSRKAELLATTIPPQPAPPPGTPVPPTNAKKLRNLVMSPLKKAERSRIARRRPPIMHAVSGFPVLHFPGRPQRDSVTQTVLRLRKRSVESVERSFAYEDDTFVWATGEDMWDNFLEEEAGFLDPDVKEDRRLRPVEDMSVFHVKEIPRAEERDQLEEVLEDENYESKPKLVRKTKRSLDRNNQDSGDLQHENDTWHTWYKKGLKYISDEYHEMKRKQYEKTLELQARIDQETELWRKVKLQTLRARRRRERKRKALIRAMKQGKETEENTMRWIKQLYRNSWPNKKHPEAF